jgi:hypothetical protein
MMIMRERCTSPSSLRSLEKRFALGPIRLTLEDTNMKSLLPMAVILGTLGACSTSTNDIVMFPVSVGTKTPLYEVVASNKLKLAPGVKFQVVDGPCGKNSAIMLLKPNGGLGGYMACGCVGAQTSSCVTKSDNPEHPSCSGACVDSEGVSHSCDLFGPIIGPPKDPLLIKLLARPASEPATLEPR